MSHRARKYFGQHVLDLKDGTVLPFNVHSSSQCCAFSLHNTFTESSIPLFSFYFNNQTSQSSNSPLLIFQIAFTFSKQVIQSSGCAALQVSIALQKCNGFGISLFCKNIFADPFLRSHLLSFRITSQSQFIIVLQLTVIPHCRCSSVIFKQQHFQHIKDSVTIACYGPDISLHTMHLIFLCSAPVHYSTAPCHQLTYFSCQLP